MSAFNNISYISHIIIIQKYQFSMHSYWYVEPADKNNHYEIENIKKINKVIQSNSPQDCFDFKSY